MEKYFYEKLNEDLVPVRCPSNDADGKITGKFIIGLKEYFDENPEERKRLGWIKHIKYTNDEIKEKWPHNAQTQYLMRTTKQIDPYTIEDEYHVADKSEEMMLLEDLLESVNRFGSGIVFIE